MEAKLSAGQRRGLTRFQWAAGGGAALIGLFFLVGQIVLTRNLLQDVRDPQPLAALPDRTQMASGWTVRKWRSPSNITTSAPYNADAFLRANPPFESEGTLSLECVEKALKVRFEMRASRGIDAANAQMHLDGAPISARWHRVGIGGLEIVDSEALLRKLPDDKVLVLSGGGTDISFSLGRLSEARAIVLSACEFQRHH